MTQRYFRVTSDAAYEAARAALDAIWRCSPGSTAIAPAANAPRDVSGCIVLAVDAAQFSALGGIEVLHDMLARGDATEIDESAYQASVRRDL